jgi:hypothetical protein
MDSNTTGLRAPTFKVEEPSEDVSRSPSLSNTVNQDKDNVQSRTTSANLQLAAQKERPLQLPPRFQSLFEDVAKSIPDLVRARYAEFLKVEGKDQTSVQEEDQVKLYPPLRM